MEQERKIEDEADGEGKKGAEPGVFVPEEQRTTSG